MIWFLNKSIDFLKWPLCLLSLAALPFLLKNLFIQISQIASGGEAQLFLLGGFGFYLFLWFLILKGSRISFFSTLEHELNHALFALITLNRVAGISASLKNGGAVKVIGPSNWLIALAPYFFPLSCFLIMLFFSALEVSISLYASSLLGMSLAYNVISTFQQVHSQQTDFKQAGVLASILFLPGAICFFLSLVLAFSLGFWQGTLDLLSSMSNEMIPDLMKLKDILDKALG